MVYYSWKRSGAEVLDGVLSYGHYIQYFMSRHDLKWRLQTDYVPKEDKRAVRIPDLYLTLIGVPQYEDSKTP